MFLAAPVGLKVSFGLNMSLAVTESVPYGNGPFSTAAKMCF